MAQFFRGNLAGLIIRTGKLENKKVIDCLYTCKEGLDVQLPEEVASAIKVRRQRKLWVCEVNLFLYHLTARSSNELWFVTSNQIKKKKKFLILNLQLLENIYLKSCIFAEWITLSGSPGLMLERIVCLLAQHQSQVMLFTNPSPCFLLSGGIQPQPVLSDCGRWRHRCLWQGHAAHLLLKLPPVPNPWNQAPAYLNHSKVSRRRRRSQKHLLFSQPGLCLVNSSVGRQQQPCVVYKAGPFCLIDIQRASLLLLKMWGWFIEVKWRSTVLPDAHNKENKHNVFCCLRMTDWRAVSIFSLSFLFYSLWCLQHWKVSKNSSSFTDLYTSMKWIYQSSRGCSEPSVRFVPVGEVV